MWKHLIDHRHALSKCRTVQCQSGIYFIKEKHQVFGSHIASQVVFGHRATAVAAQGAIIATASIAPGGFYFLPPVVRLGVQVRAKFNLWIGRYQIAEQVGNILRIGAANRVRQRKDADAHGYQHIYPALHDFHIPGVAIRVSEAHGNV